MTEPTITDLMGDDETHSPYDRLSVPGRAPGGSTLPEQGWYQWHAPYDDLESEQTDRLAAVQAELVAYFDTAPAGPVRVLSVCSGQSRDLLPILISHPRGRDVRATLLELDPLNASFLDGALGSTDLVDVEVVVTDAGLPEAYVGLPPADLVLLCGVFANVSPADAARTVDVLLPAVCAPGATVVWSSYGADVADVAALFGSRDFHQAGLRRDPHFVVGSHRFTGATRPPATGERIFGFLPAGPA